MLYIIIGILGSTMDYQSGTDWAGTSQTGTLAAISNYATASQSSNFNPIELPWMVVGAFPAWFQIIMLKFHMFEGAGFSMFYSIVIFPIAVLGVMGMIMLVINAIRGNIAFG